MRHMLLTIILLISLLPQSGFAAYCVGKTGIIGRVEYVSIPDAGIVEKARIDTGAGVSSLNAQDIKITKTVGKPDMVSFKLTDSFGKTHKFKHEVLEYANIKNKGTEGFQQRPVIVWDLCMGGKRIEGRINLTDRSDFLYPLLVGRNILKAGDFLIAPEKKFMHAAECP